MKCTGQPVYLHNLLSDYEPVSDTELALALWNRLPDIFVALQTLILLNVASKLIYLTLHSPPSAGQSVSINNFHAGTLNTLLTYTDLNPL